MIQSEPSTRLSLQLPNTLLEALQQEHPRQYPEEDIPDFNDFLVQILQEAVDAMRDE